VKVIFIFLILSICSGCDEIKKTFDPDNYRARADSNVWASKNDILLAASRCSEQNIKTVPAGDTWSIETKDGKAISREKSQCIKDDLSSQNLLVTR
jgi:hypothetical protein